MKMGNIASPWRYDAILNTPLPQAIAPTLYSRFGDGLAGLLLAVALVVVVRRRIWDRPVGEAPSKQRS